MRACSSNLLPSSYDISASLSPWLVSTYCFSGCQVPTNQPKQITSFRIPNNKREPSDSVVATPPLPPPPWRISMMRRSVSYFHTLRRRIKTVGSCWRCTAHAEESQDTDSDGFPVAFWLRLTVGQRAKRIKS